MVALQEYVSGTVDHLMDRLGHLGFTADRPQELAEELRPPYLLIRPVTARRRDENTSWVTYRAYLYWQGARQKSALEGGRLAWVLYSLLAEWSFAADIRMDYGVVDPDYGYVDYMVTWDDITDHDSSPPSVDERLDEQPYPIDTIVLHHDPQT